ncbi:uncharacterized protein BYT42DRAFT_578544 [Radiomyces spectabilis]|uniref:uncharacterized protein n=1 Tax=Radiomyces spectabilis TaxID=64574 RepID=UPI002220C243|nr:uncharacterized protein BYT42DRAFT_578544 [Radiomyces spectabilis]KAI8372920.1 hypothetical protein BYT42DRAFT_578544 [Radiomyces spectabilis]
MIQVEPVSSRALSQVLPNNTSGTTVSENGRSERRSVISISPNPPSTYSSFSATGTHHSTDHSAQRPSSSPIIINNHITTFATQYQAAMVVPAKRGFKSHVPSACINCKKAHLACDVARPCKRCVTLGKQDTCHDIKHKKRGRPKLQDKKSSNDRCEIMYGTVLTPTFAMATSASKPKHTRPSSSSSSSPSPTPIAFIHEPVESFYSESLAPANDGNPAKAKTETVDPSYLSSYAKYTAIAPDTVRPKPPLPPSQQLPRIAMDASYPYTTSGPYQDDRHTIVVLMSMELCCARVSDTVTEFWGYYPQELAHRTLYDFISPDDNERLASLHRMLLDNMLDVINANNPAYERKQPPPAERTTSDLFHSTHLSQLRQKVKGSKTFSETLRIRNRGGLIETFQMTAYMGGGLGADLISAMHLTKLYIVAEFRKCQSKVVSDTNVSMPCFNLTASTREDSPQSTAASMQQHALYPSTSYIQPLPSPHHDTTLRSSLLQALPGSKSRSQPHAGFLPKSDVLPSVEIRRMNEPTRGISQFGPLPGSSLIHDNVDQLMSEISLRDRYNSPSPTKPTMTISSHPATLETDIKLDTQPPGAVHINSQNRNAILTLVKKVQESSSSQDSSNRRKVEMSIHSLLC